MSGTGCCIRRVATEGSSSIGTRASASRERLKRSQKSMKAEGSAPAASPCSPSEEVPAAATMTEVKVKTEVPDDYIQEVIWQDDTKDSKKNVKDGAGEVPAEICVVIGGVRNQQTLGKLGSYECGICGKKYKYYNCFQTHVRAHRDTEAASGEGVSQGNNFRYTCDICGKKYKYYSCFQEHRDLHAVDVDGPNPSKLKTAVQGESGLREICFPRPLRPGDDCEGRSEGRGPRALSEDWSKYDLPSLQLKNRQLHLRVLWEAVQVLHPLPGARCASCAHHSECSYPEYSRSPLFVAVKTPASQAGKKTSAASIIRCSTLLHRTPSGVPPASQSQMFRAPNSGSPGSKATTESAFSRRVENKLQNNFEETNSNSQNSSETASPLVSNPLPLLQKPYTCGACGIQFQFYNNLLEHMQSHAADNENNIASNQVRSPPAVVEEKWRPQPQRTNANSSSLGLQLPGEQHHPREGAAEHRGAAAAGDVRRPGDPQRGEWEGLPQAGADAGRQRRPLRRLLRHRDPGQLQHARPQAPAPDVQPGEGEGHLRPGQQRLPGHRRHLPLAEHRPRLVLHPDRVPGGGQQHQELRAGHQGGGPARQRRPGPPLGAERALGIRDVGDPDGVRDGLHGELVRLLQGGHVLALLGVCLELGRAERAQQAHTAGAQHARGGGAAERLRGPGGLGGHLQGDLRLPGGAGPAALLELRHGLAAAGARALRADLRVLQPGQEDEPDPEPQQAPAEQPGRHPGPREAGRGGAERREPAHPAAGAAHLREAGEALHRQGQRRRHHQQAVPPLPGSPEGELQGPRGPQGGHDPGPPAEAAAGPALPARGDHRQGVRADQRGEGVVGRGARVRALRQKATDVERGLPGAGG
ncbi:zinc finger protein 618 isoform X12 [Varanus komodoensis]|uniref:zinc finger protein 618 isoform X12 n=1 Tax=Varanus komodoensis TaxID=61221 RepID=UPI001CF79BAF|nr:zinc finger protein 618 isoform X12 [Varanus komodoensis]